MTDKGNKRKNLKDFLAEAEELLESFSRDLFKLEEGIESGKTDPDILNSIFRSAHTLKGISGLFGFNQLSTLSHALEDTLDSLRMGRVSISKDILNSLMEGCSLINNLIAKSGQGKEADEAVVNAFIDDLHKACKPAEAESATGIDLGEEIKNSLTEYEEHRLQENIRAGNTLCLIGATYPIDTFDTELMSLTEVLKAKGEVIATIPSASSDSDKLHFDLLFGMDTDIETLTEVLGGTTVAIKVFQDSVNNKKVKYQESPLEKSDEPVAVQESIRSVSSTVRIDISKLDSVMNVIGELGLIRSRVSQLAVRMRDEMAPREYLKELTYVDKYLEKKLQELQDSVMDIRLVPISQLFDRYARSVRKMSLDTGKDVDLVIVGGDTELDKILIEDLADPLLHIIRNAIDHGIEDPAVREKAGKPLKGRLVLNAYPKGNHVVIEISDDGAGIDIDRVKEKAIKQNLIDKNRAEHISYEEVMELIFLPGFSIKSDVSELSGRGVGMDVVKSNISRIGGMIDIESNKGEGTTIRLTIPITLAIIGTLIIQAGSRCYTIPMNSLVEVLEFSPNDIKTVEKKEVLCLRGRTIPLVRLNEFFGSHKRRDDTETLCGIVTGVADVRLCLVVDKIIGRQDVVIKTFGRILKAKGVAGATDLGRLGIAFVLDIPGIISESIKDRRVGRLMSAH